MRAIQKPYLQNLSLIVSRNGHPRIYVSLPFDLDTVTVVIHCAAERRPDVAQKVISLM